MVVGLTGGIGSGKTTVVNQFKKFNDIAVYIADVEAKKLMTSSTIISTELTKEFGKDVYVNGELNRKYLAQIVFNDKEKLARLNAIVHPVVHEHFAAFINANKKKTYILYENAILFENKSNQFCDIIITVTAPLKTKIERVIQRDNTTEKEVLSRMKNQYKDEVKMLQSNYVIHNIDLNATMLKVDEIHKKLTKNKTSI